MILIFGGISHFIDETKERNANREIEKAREKERDGENRERFEIQVRDKFGKGNLNGRDKWTDFECSNVYIVV